MSSATNVKHAVSSNNAQDMFPGKMSPISLQLHYKWMATRLGCEAYRHSLRSHEPIEAAAHVVLASDRSRRQHRGSQADLAVSIGLPARARGVVGSVGRGLGLIPRAHSNDVVACVLAWVVPHLHECLEK